MPNGFHGPTEEWARLEKPLVKLDARLAKFALDHQLSLSKNYHSDPERSLVSSNGGLRRLNQIYLEDERDLTFNVWICVSEDRGEERLWKNQFLLKSAPAQEIDDKLESLPTRALEIAQSWSSTDLVLARK